MATARRPSSINQLVAIAVLLLEQGQQLRVHDPQDVLVLPLLDLEVRIPRQSRGL
jgi:hypothetical protein